MILDDTQLAARLDPIPDSWDDAPGLRRAAVLAPIFHHDQQDWLLLTERRTDLAHHAGQISFPGGAREPDEDPVSCVLRETREEIGVNADE